jgi:hypothetical protein
MLAKSGISTRKLLGWIQSLMHTKKRDGTVIVKAADKQATECYHALKVKVPLSGRPHQVQATDHGIEVKRSLIMPPCMIQLVFTAVYGVCLGGVQ